MCLLARSENKRMTTIYIWALSDARRIGLPLFCLIDSTLLIGINHQCLKNCYLNQTTIEKDLQEIIQKLTTTNHYLIGLSGFPSILREDSEDFPPLSVISNGPLFHYLIQKESEKSSKSSTIFSAVFQNSQDAIFCLNKYETIEMVNRAVTNLFGFTPEQLLGQHLSSIFASNKCKDI